VSGLTQMRFHFGERDRDGDGPLEAAVMDACARHGVRAAALLRGVEGFGAKHLLRTDRLLSLSEDPPLVAVAVGEAEVVEALAAEVRPLAADGLLVLEDLTTGPATSSAAVVAGPVVGAAGDVEGTERVRVSVWGPRSGPASPHLEAVAALRRHGAESATVLLGVDGVLDGSRRRARFIAANRGVPAITIGIGERAALEAAVAEVNGAAHLVTYEPVELYSRIAGGRLHTDAAVETFRLIGTVSLHGDADGSPPAGAVRVTLATTEAGARDGRTACLEFVRRLRRDGAPGATSLRGVWGFRRDGEPHGDRVLALRRDVPTLVEVVDAPERAPRWLELAGELACEGDVVYAQPIRRVLTLE
jgi:PII-like signaling protein